jgi:DNA-binding NarL/FixJ family response regulator
MRGAGRVLVVDDHDFFARTVEAIVWATDGLEVAGRARNGVEALKLTHTLRPDLIVMDVEMPSMDGVTATRRLRRSGYAGPIVICSGSDVEVDALRALAAGATSFVRKSRAAVELIPAIQAALRHASEDELVQAC